MATTNQYPSGVADWATVCAWVRENRPDLWGTLGPDDEDRTPAT
jgi:hypothetical protein